MEDEGWERQRNRRDRRNEHHSEGSNKALSKFFVSNLPPKCSSQDLKEILGKFGNYEGSYIARKLDKWGKRFGFVSFSGVRDIIGLENEFSDVWLGSYKLFITVARFVDGQKVSRPVKDQGRTSVSPHTNSHANPSQGNTIDLENTVQKAGNGRSFVDSVLNRNKVDVITVDDSVERFGHWFECALRGKVVDLHTLTSLRKLLTESGWGSLDIKYLGGLSVVLVFYESGDVDKFMHEESTWSVWFEGLQKWAGDGRVDEGRIAWLQVHGVPAQLTLDNVFDSIGKRYGKVIQSASISGDDNNLSYALIGVLSKECKRIEDRVNIMWRGISYSVWVDEDAGEWIPECVVELEEDDVSVSVDAEKESDNVQQENEGNIQGDEGEVPKVVMSSGGETNANGFASTADVVLEDVVAVGVESPSQAPVQTEVNVSRKKYRRKSLFKNRNEGSGSLERPKKRPRDDNDIFGVDRLIGILSNGSSSFEGGDLGNDEVISTPDVNSSMAEVENVKANMVAANTVTHEALFGPPPIDLETIQTVELSRALGVENLDNFVPKVKEVLRSEGYQEVDQ